HRVGQRIDGRIPRASARWTSGQRLRCGVRTRGDGAVHRPEDRPDVPRLAPGLVRAMTRSADVGDLAGRRVLVTGAPGGLGVEICRGLAAAGAAVAIHHLGQAAAADELAAELIAAGAPAVVVEGDVTDWDQTAGFIDAAESALGPLDVVVNNAGVMAPAAITEMTLEQWRHTLAVDLDGVFIVS